MEGHEQIDRGGGGVDGDALLLDGVLALLKKFNTNFLIN
jgi:hypothetical protein